MALLRLLAGLVGGTVRLAFSLVGMVLVLVGIVLSLTFIGAIIGIPLILLGVVCFVIGFWFAPRRRLVRREYVYVRPGGSQERSQGRQSVAGGTVIDVKKKP